MRYEKWDKQTPIYDLSPERVMENDSRYRDEDSYIIYNDDSSIFDLVLANDIGVDGIDSFIKNIEQSSKKNIPVNEDITAEDALEIIFGKRRLSRSAALKINEILRNE